MRLLCSSLCFAALLVLSTCSVEEEDVLPQNDYFPNNDGGDSGQAGGSSDVDTPKVEDNFQVDPGERRYTYRRSTQPPDEQVNFNEADAEVAIDNNEWDQEVELEPGESKFDSRRSASHPRNSQHVAELQSDFQIDPGEPKLQFRRSTLQPYRRRGHGARQGAQTQKNLQIHWGTPRKETGSDQEGDIHTNSHDDHHPKADKKLRPVVRKHNIDTFHPGLSGSLRAAEEAEISNEVAAQVLSEKTKEIHIDSIISTTTKSAGEPVVNNIDNEDDNPEPVPKQSGDTDELDEDDWLELASTQVSDLTLLYKGRDWTALHGSPHPSENDDENEEDEFDLSSRPDTFSLFTISNTDIGIEYEKLPYREKYLWSRPNAPCHSFPLKIPDERAEKSVVTLCIFRPHLDFPDETKHFILSSDEEAESKNVAPVPRRVFGHVLNMTDSFVNGTIGGGHFYGNVTLTSENKTSTFIVENIRILNRLMRNNQKMLGHMLTVLNAKGKDEDESTSQTVYNAVVTKGTSLVESSRDLERTYFMMFSTNHNSYIVFGDSQIFMDEFGEAQLIHKKSTIVVANDRSVEVKSPRKKYTFRPHGRTMVKEGLDIRTLQKHEGAISITAITSSSSYDCVLPTPVFQQKRGSYVCKVCLAADAQFFEYFAEPKVDSKGLAPQVLLRLIDRVSWILRTIDLDGDSVSDNIGIDYDPHVHNWSYPDLGNEDATTADVQLLFSSLDSLGMRNCCLGIGFTMKRFPDDSIARKPSPATTVGPTGVCNHYDPGRISSNLIMISANDKKGEFSSFTEDQLTFLTAHFVAGAFGAVPDGTVSDDCDQFDDGGTTRHFLMWPDVLRNTSLREESLSQCSIHDIAFTLSTCKSACFDVNKHPFCGNGIVEDGEECDCGSAYNCSQQTCCYSRMDKYPCRKSGVGCPLISGASSLSSAKIGFLLISMWFSLAVAGTLIMSRS